MTKWLAPWRKLFGRRGNIHGALTLKTQVFRAGRRGIFATLMQPRLRYQHRDKHLTVLKPPLLGGTFVTGRGGIFTTRIEPRLC